MKLFNKSKKGNSTLSMLGGIAVALVSVAIVLVVGFLITSNAYTQIDTLDGIDHTNATQCKTSHACNATTDVNTAMATVPTWLSLIVLAMIGSVLLGLIALFRKGRS